MKHTKSRVDIIKEFIRQGKSSNYIAGWFDGREGYTSQVEELAVINSEYEQGYKNGSAYARQH